ncbi:hypothetical protein Q4I32_004221 [Leishmania shawi]|uniref:Uncharacterized protein n=1 Tax=Leishmania shawi TaxID=5680 RepID=A0AAW3BSH4_9TRYP
MVFFKTPASTQYSEFSNRLMEYMPVNVLDAVVSLQSWSLAPRRLWPLQAGNTHSGEERQVAPRRHRLYGLAFP